MYQKIHLFVFTQILNIYYMMLLERKYNYVCNFAEQATSSDTLKNFRDMNLRISYTKSCIFAKMPNSQFLVIAIDALL